MDRTKHPLLNVSPGRVGDKAMTRIRIFVVLLLLLFAEASWAQEVLKTFSVSQRYSNLSGTPRIVRNENQQSWLISWRQQNRILARVIQPNGTAGSQHAVASSVVGSERCFDVAYDPSRNRYALVYQTRDGLQFVFLTVGLKQTGIKQRIAQSAESTSPQVVFAPGSQNFLVIWLEDPAGVGQRKMMSAVVDTAGNVSGPQVVAQTEAAFGFADLRAAVNAKNSDILVLVRRVNLDANPGRGALVAYVLNPSGLLSRKAPLVLQPESIGFNSSAQMAFTPDGSGFVVWSYGTSLRYRKLSASFGFNSSVKNIADAADADSANPSLVYDSVGDQFVAAWTAGGKLESVVWNSSGAIMIPPFEVSRSPGGHSQNPDASLDPQQGNLLTTWEDSSETAPPVSFQVRASLFFPGRKVAEQNVTVGDNFFTPKNLTVNLGSVITWTNQGFNAHTVTSGTPFSQIGMLFDSGAISHGGKFSFRFTRTGSIPYFCRVHGAIQSGTINVVK